MTTKRIIKKIHPVAELFPLLNDAELAGLAETIKAIGLLTPIVLDPKGVLLDGRNRLKACKMAGVEPRFEIYDGEPVAFIMAANDSRRHLTAGQRAIIALAFREPEKCGRGRPSQLSKLEGYSASRVSEARKIIKFSRDLAQDVIDKKRTFQDALDEATIVRAILVNTDTPVAPTIVTSADLIAAKAKADAQKRADQERRQRWEAENAERRESVAALLAHRREVAQAEPGRAKEDPVEQWLFDWEPEELADRVIAADRLKPGYAQEVVDAILAKMGGLPMVQH